MYFRILFKKIFNKRLYNLQLNYLLNIINKSYNIEALDNKTLNVGKGKKVFFFLNIACSQEKSDMFCSIACYR